MDKQIIEGLNIYAKYDITYNNIEAIDGVLIINFISFSGEDELKLVELGWEQDKEYELYYYTT